MYIFFILALRSKESKKTLERGNRRSARTVYLNTKASGTPKLHIPHALHGDFFNHEWIGILITDTPITDNRISRTVCFLPLNTPNTRKPERYFFERKRRGTRLVVPPLGGLGFSFYFVPFFCTLPL